MQQIDTMLSFKGQARGVIESKTQSIQLLNKGLHIYKQRPSTVRLSWEMGWWSIEEELPSWTQKEDDACN